MNIGPDAVHANGRRDGRGGTRRKARQGENQEDSGEDKAQTPPTVLPGEGFDLGGREKTSKRIRNSNRENADTGADLASKKEQSSCSGTKDRNHG